jgi:hypothetical protein
MVAGKFTLVVSSIVPNFSHHRLPQLKADVHCAVEAVGFAAAIGCFDGD